LAAEVENLTLTGLASINATGNSVANTLRGNAGNNVLTGGAGSDTMLGGAGDDTYVVDVATDVVTELVGEGTDTVQSAVTLTLGANIENLVLTGTTAINGTGNAVANMLTGNSVANVLTGGAGDDIYVVGTGDTTIEAAGGGTDTVQAGVTWTLAAEVENLTLTGTTAINGTGNALNNVLAGNSAINVLTGGAGNDTYYVTSGDTTTEAASAGTDTVVADLTWTLATNVENLTLTGTTAVNGTGNTLDNVLTGNSAANTLTGLAGNDTYIGGAGNDVLTDTSTTSNDIYRWGVGQGNDTITDAGGADRIEIAAGVTAAQVSLVRSGNNLQVKITGATDVLTVVNWYTATANRVETIALADGTVINAGTTAPLSVAALSSRESIQMERTPTASKAAFMPSPDTRKLPQATVTGGSVSIDPKTMFVHSPNTLKLPQAVLAGSAVEVARGTQLLVQAMAQFDGNSGAADIATPMRWRDDRVHVQLATPW
jgi:Ca2+-binding RTX toxin-like protein